MATAAELQAARDELNRVNEQHGFSRRGAPPKGVTGDPKANGPSVDQPTATNSDQAVPGGETVGTAPQDPGPPRFLGVDIENKLAGLSGGAVFSISDDASQKIIKILLRELRVNMAQSLATVARTHNQVVDPKQLEIPFSDKA